MSCQATGDHDADLLDPVIYAAIRVVTLHNLSAEPARVRLPDDLGGVLIQGGIRQLLGDTTSPGSGGPGTAARAGLDLELAGYGFRWLRLTDDSALG